MVDDMSHKKDRLLAEDEMPNRAPLDPAVSVYMLAYQHAEYVKQAVEAVLAQKTDFPFEICLGEDESSDGTREICKTLAETHPDKIRLFLRSRKDVIKIDGRPTARYNGNMTRKACRGKYIAICECDDFWIDEDKLQKQFDFLENNPQASVCGTRGIQRFFGNGNVPDIVMPVRFNKRLEHDWFLSGKTGVLTASLVYRVSDANKHLLYDPKVVAGDWALLLGATENGKYCAVLNDISVVYRQHGRGAWTGIDGLAKLKLKKATLAQFLIHSQRVDTNGLAQQSLEILNRRIAYAEAAQAGKLSKLKYLVSQLFDSAGRRFLGELIEARKSRVTSIQ